MNINIKFAGIIFQFVLPTEIFIPNEFQSFLTNENNYNEKFSVELITTPLNVNEDNKILCNGIQIFKTKEECLRIFNALTIEDGCQVASLLTKKGENILYYPKEKWDFYKKQWRVLHLLGIEEILIKYNAFLLHSSLVNIDGKTVLFSGPSGIGKSTQASLWKKYLGAKILNGDRTIIRKMDDIFYGCGSPWAGTSKIYNNEMAPIAGIILLKQSKENKIRKVGIDGFSSLLNQSIVNTWDYEFMNTISSLIGEVLENIPVYELSCRMDEEAVRMTYSTIFKGDNEHDR